MAGRDARHLALAQVSGGPAAAGRVYQLWVLKGGAKPRPIGLLPNASRAALDITEDDARALAAADGVAISLEPAGGSPTGLPTGPILFKGSLLAQRAS
jgi:anti-sigma-K factor RskA